MTNSNDPSTFIVDVDDTLTFSPKDIQSIADYNNALPKKRVINKVNALYSQGHKIVLYTARGNTLCSNPDIDARTGLEKWLKDNKVKYHELHFGKLSYPDTKTYYVGDEVLTLNQFVNETNYEKTKQANCLLRENKVLILGNGTSRLQLKDTIQNWNGEIWVCNWGFREALTLGDRVTLVGSVHKEVLKEIHSFRKEHNLSYKIITKPIIKSQYEDEYFSSSKGWSTGNLCIVEALERGYDEVYLAGFDMGGKDIYQTHDLPGGSFKSQYEQIKKTYGESKITFLKPNTEQPNLPLLPLVRTKIKSVKENTFSSECVPWPKYPKDSVLIIGNGTNALDEKLGKKIDEFPFVVRLNDYVTEGFEKYIGSKTDLWFCACSHHTKVRGRKVDFGIGLLAKKAREKTKDMMMTRTGISIEDLYYLPDDVFEKIHRYFGDTVPSVSTGMRAILLFKEILKIPNVYVLGFDFYKEGLHYYKDIKTEHLGKGHDWDTENTFFHSLLADKKIIPFSSKLPEVKRKEIIETKKADKPIKNILLFGNSGALKGIDKEQLEKTLSKKDVVTGGINRIYKLFQPDFYFYMDGAILHELQAKGVKRNKDSKWMIPSFMFKNTGSPITRKEVDDYIKRQRIEEISAFPFEEHTKKKSSMIWLIVYLQNVVFKNYKCKFYLYGVSLEVNKEQNYFFGNAKMNKGVNHLILQQQYDSQLAGYRALLDKGYNIVSLTPDSKLNNYAPHLTTSLEKFLDGMPDK